METKNSNETTSHGRLNNRKQQNQQINKANNQDHEYTTTTTTTTTENQENSSAWRTDVSDPSNMGNGKPDNRTGLKISGNGDGEGEGDGLAADLENDKLEGHQAAGKEPFKAEVVWKNIILFVILHSCIPVGIYMLYAQRPQWPTIFFSIMCMYASGIGVTAGTHRLWSHRSYKAKWPIQVLLVILQTMAGQNSAYTWSRDHRVHHKYSETDADPHNIKRGFFFAHMGWLLCKKHPDVKEKGKSIDMSDLKANPYVMFQHRHFWWMAIMFTVLVPTMIPVMVWGERFWTSFVFAFMLRYLLVLHSTWLVNSAAHYYGDRPYDTKIEARESPVVMYNALGEGFHNYHHTFPFDYATSEFGRYFNITTAFIDLCSTLGLTYDKRKVDSESILRRRLRTGDLTEEQLQELRLKRQAAAATAEGAGSNNTNGATQAAQQMRRRSGGHQKSSTIQEDDEVQMSSSLGGLQEKGNSAENGNGRSSNPLAPLNNIIHELPYISGLTSMKYTM